MKGVSYQTAPPEAMLSATVETRRFKKFVDALATLNHPVPMEMTGLGLGVIACGPANVQYTEATLPVEDFEDYSGKPGTFGFQTVPAQRALERIDTTTVEVATTEDGIRIDDERIETVDVDDLPPAADVDDIIDDQFAELKITGRQFARALEAYDRDDANTVQFRTRKRPDGISISTSAEFGDEHIQETVFGDEDAQSWNASDSGSSRFSYDYISVIADAITASPPVTIRFGKKRPVTIRYPLLGAWTDDERAYVTHHVAPRIAPSDREGDS